MGQWLSSLSPRAKRIIISVLMIVLGGVAATFGAELAMVTLATSGSNATSVSLTPTLTQPSFQETPTVAPTIFVAPPMSTPWYPSDPAPQTDATAICSDGTYSYSQHHRGTCSYHGGVEQWLQ